MTKEIDLLQRQQKILALKRQAKWERSATSLPDAKAGIYAGVTSLFAYGVFAALVASLAGGIIVAVLFAFGHLCYPIINIPDGGGEIWCQLTNSLRS